MPRPELMIVGRGNPVALTNILSASNADACVSYGLFSPQSRSSQKALNHFAFFAVRPSSSKRYLAHPKYASNPCEISPSTTPSISSIVSTKVCLGAPFFNPTTQYKPSEASTDVRKGFRVVIVRSFTDKYAFRSTGDRPWAGDQVTALAVRRSSSSHNTLRLLGCGSAFPKNHM